MPNYYPTDDEVLGASAPPRRGDYSGYVALGDLLAGGPQQRAEARAPAYLGAASDAAYKFNRAAGERAKAIIEAAKQHSREAMPDALGGIYDPKQAALAAAILGSADTPNMHSLGDFQTPGHAALVQAQQDALASGDYKRMNATTAVLGDKQFEPVLQRGGAYIENGATLGDLDAIPTPTALATIEQKEAATRQGQQRTDAAVAKSNRTPAAHAAHSSAAAADEAQVLAEARARIKTPEDARKVADYLRAKGYPNVAKKLYQP